MVYIGNTIYSQVLLNIRNKKKTKKYIYLNKPLLLVKARNINTISMYLFIKPLYYLCAFITVATHYQARSTLIFFKTELSSLNSETAVD